MLVFYDHPEEMEDIRIRVLPKESEDPLRGLPPDTQPAEGEEEEEAESFEEEDEPGAKPSKGKPPASSDGVVVKKKGTIIRLKSKKGEEPEEEDVEEVDVEEIDDVPVEVEEEGDVEDVE